MESSRYSIKLDFEAIRIPPVTDILVLGSTYKHGKLGIFESFKFLAPEEFSFYDYLNESFSNVGTIAIRKKLLRRIDYDKIEKVLQENVFPYMDESEAINVNFTVRCYIDGIELSNNDT